MSTTPQNLEEEVQELDDDVFVTDPAFIQMAKNAMEEHRQGNTVCLEDVCD